MITAATPQRVRLIPWAKALVDKAGSYAEITPSKTGVRIIGRGVGAKEHHKAPVHGEVSCEIYRAATRYITVSGDVLLDAPLANIDEHIDAVRDELKKSKKQSKGNGHAKGETNELSPKLVSTLSIAGSGGYPSRSELLFAFLAEALRKKIKRETIADACLDEKYRGFGIFQHCRENGGRDYLLRQITHVVEKLSADAVARGNFTEDDFYAYLPQHNYIFVPTREFWPTASVNNVLTGLDGKPSEYLDRYKPVVQATWVPGLPMIIEDRIVADGGWIDRPHAKIMNLYRPPRLVLGDASKAGRWADHFRLIYPDTAEEMMDYFAHTVQKPQEKINYGVVLGGEPGIGKDTLLEPVKQAVGPWNFAEVSPAACFSDFNPFTKSVVLRVSEARDLGDHDRYGFYDHMKVYEAAPPDVLRVNEKHMREYYAFNVCRVVYTTNNKTTGLYLPAEDRRHLVDWSEKIKDEFDEAYWDNFWHSVHLRGRVRPRRGISDGARPVAL